FEACDLERLHELPDQHIIQVVGNAPKEEQHRHQDERYHRFPGKEAMPGPVRACRGRLSGRSIDHHGGYADSRIIFAYWVVSPVRIRPTACGTRFLKSI